MMTPEEVDKQYGRVVIVAPTYRRAEILAKLLSEPTPLLVSNAYGYDQLLRLEKARDVLVSNPGWIRPSIMKQLATVQSARQ